MNKKEVIGEVAEAAGISRKQSEEVVDCILGTIKEALKKGNKVTLQDFGTFSVASRKAREGRNPRTGEPVSIPATKVPKFTPGKSFKESLNQ